MIFAPLQIFAPLRETSTRTFLTRTWTKESCFQISTPQKHAPSHLAQCLLSARRAQGDSMYEVSRSHIARAILDYLLEHPDAQDTLAGIAEWWLPEEKMKTRSAIVKDALDQLVAEALVLERRGKDLQTHYRINGHRLKEIEKLVTNRP
jgi:hypothetical protein